MNPPFLVALDERPGANTTAGRFVRAIIAALLAAISCPGPVQSQCAPSASRPVIGSPDTTVEAGFQAVSGPHTTSGADVFYVAYSKPNDPADKTRPIVFAYNGGPGGSSAGVHIGAFGPRVLAPVEPGALGSVSDRLVTNPDTLMRVADLVFIDPPGSGLSRVAAGADPADFYGVEADAAATAAFITGYLRKHCLRGRPLFIMGESYGTLRTVLVTRLLQRSGIRPAGLILMGLILDNATLFAQSGDDEPYWLFLPSEAATARFHGRANTGLSLTDTLAAAEQYASGPYLVALAQGSNLPPQTRSSVRANLSRWLGEPVDTERVTPEHFITGMLAGSLRLSRADGRFAGPSDGEGPMADPLYATMLPLYRLAMTRYLRDELSVAEVEDYRVLDTRIADVWQWSDTPLGSPTALSVGDSLRDALRADTTLSVFVASGIYDLTSPVLAADYTLAHISGVPEEMARLRNHRYESGHMIYVSADARHRLSADITRYISGRVAAGKRKGG